jgi:hypothetical protein
VQPGRHRQDQCHSAFADAPPEIDQLAGSQGSSH